MSPAEERNTCKCEALKSQGALKRPPNPGQGKQNLKRERNQKRNPREIETHGNPLLHKGKAVSHKRKNPVQERTRLSTRKVKLRKGRKKSPL